MYKYNLCYLTSKKSSHFRAVGSSENFRVPVLIDGHNLPPLVEIAGMLQDLKLGGGGGRAIRGVKNLGGEH